MASTSTVQVGSLKSLARICMILLLIAVLTLRPNKHLRKLSISPELSTQKVHSFSSSLNSSVPAGSGIIRMPRPPISVPFVEKSKRSSQLLFQQQHQQEQPAVQRSQRQWNKKMTKVNFRNAAIMAQQYDLPPLDSLIGDLEKNVTGEVQFLLDFAIVGFGKCGTTALIDWLDNHPEVNTIPKEALHLSRHRPALMAQKLYEMKVDSLKIAKEMNESVPSRGRIQGFKNPSDIRRPESMAYLRQYWPGTKLVITVRHPVHWFRSLYNFLLNEMGRTKKFLHRNSLIGGAHKNTAYAHTGKGEFHAILSLLGKTDMAEDAELELLKGFLREDEINQWPMRLPNKIFFLETTQMADKNESRAAKFRKDLQEFLGLQQGLPPVLHVRPGKDRKVQQDLKIDMCSAENTAIRQELMRISKKASLWFRNFLLNSPDVVVSSRDYLEDIFASSWLQDPCAVNNTTTES